MKLLYTLLFCQALLAKQKEEDAKTVESLFLEDSDPVLVNDLARLQKDQALVLG